MQTLKYALLSLNFNQQAILTFHGNVPKVAVYKHGIMTAYAEQGLKNL